MRIPYDIKQNSNEGDDTVMSVSRGLDRWIDEKVDISTGGQVERWEIKMNGPIEWVHSSALDC